jgi:hypothetical protein
MKLALLLIASAMGLAAQTHSATLTWTDTLNPAGTTYSVYRATGLCSGSPTFSKIASAIVPKTYQDTTVTPGNYCFQATAAFNSVESAPSNSASAAVPSFAPTSLVVVTAEVFIPPTLKEFMEIVSDLRI